MSRGVDPVQDPSELVRVGIEFVRRFGLADRILERHVPDRNGRCRGCTLPGYGTPHLTWPCLIHGFAAGASAAG